MSKTQNSTAKAKNSAKKSNNAISKKTRRDIKQEVTDRIIAIMEQGTEAWRKTWQTVAAEGFPSNAASGKPYSGINVIILWSAAQEAGYTSNKWLTYRQAAAIGGVVRKGEKGTGIVFYSPLTIEDKESGEEKEIHMLKSFTVFNVRQIDGLPESFQDKTSDLTPLPFSPDEMMENVIWESGAKIEHGPYQPCYIPSADVIRLPEPEAFNTPENYYATAAHELIHWTGHESRLDRDIKNKFGNKDYAREELVAELGAAFLGAHTGILDATIEGHASYLDSWLKVLKEDKNAIFQAASQAQKAFDYLLKAA